MSVIKSNRGFTLVEFLVAVVILTVGLLGLLQTINMAIVSNKGNQLRNEAVIAADQAISQQLAKGFDLASTSQGSSVISRPLLNGFQNYSVFRSGTDFPSTSSKKINIEVRWRYKNTSYSHDATAVITKQ